MPMVSTYCVFTIQSRYAHMSIEINALSLSLCVSPSHSFSVYIYFSVIELEKESGTSNAAGEYVLFV